MKSCDAAVLPSLLLRAARKLSPSLGSPSVSSWGPGPGAALWYCSVAVNGEGGQGEWLHVSGRAAECRGDAVEVFCVLVAWLQVYEMRYRARDFFLPFQQRDVIVSILLLVPVCFAFESVSPAASN